MGLIAGILVAVRVMLCISPFDHESVEETDFDASKDEQIHPVSPRVKVQTRNNPTEKPHVTQNAIQDS